MSAGLRTPCVLVYFSCGLLACVCVNSFSRRTTCRRREDSRVVSVECPSYIGVLASASTFCGVAVPFNGSISIAYLFRFIFTVFVFVLLVVFSSLLSNISRAAFLPPVGYL